MKAERLRGQLLQIHRVGLEGVPDHS
jgi:hypothetical protein